MLDTIDSKAIDALQKDGRASWADLGTALGLSAPAAAERVRKLSDGGVVRGFTAVLDAPAAGFPVLAFVSVRLDAQGARTAFLEGVRRHDLIQECHHVAGDDDFLLKVRARSLAELDSLLSDELKGRLGIARTRTTIVLGTAKETGRLPVGAAEPSSGRRSTRPGPATTRGARRTR